MTTFANSTSRNLLRRFLYRYPQASYIYIYMCVCVCVCIYLLNHSPTGKSCRSEMIDHTPILVRDHQLTLMCENHNELLFTPLEFFTSGLAGGFHWSLSDSKSAQVSRTLLSILVVLSEAVIWIVSTRPPTSKSSRSFNNPLVIVPKAQITIGTIVTFMFHSFFNSLARLRHLSFFSRSFRIILWSANVGVRNSKRRE